jgi:hypothetical protein
MLLKNCLISTRTEIRLGFSGTLGLLISLGLALGPGTARAQIGNLMMWGDTESGQLAEPAPPEVFTKVANYYATVVGLRQDGSIKVWGHEEDIVDNVPTGSGYTDVTVMSEAGFAINQSGQIVGWGNDYSVGLLSGIPPGSGYVSVVGAYQAVFALNQAGEILAWGSDEYLLISQRPTGGGFTKVVENGDATALALAADGSIRAWGYDEDVVDNVPAGTGYRDIAGAYHGAVAIKEDGTLVAWGGGGIPS